MIAGETPGPAAAALEITALRTVGLTVGYRQRRVRTPVLRDLNVSVRAGELVCWLGSNGIGKSTLLRTISKIQAPLAGQVEIGGIDIQRLSQLETGSQIGRCINGTSRCRGAAGLSRCRYWAGIPTSAGPAN